MTAPHSLPDCQIGHLAPHLISIRLRDARQRYEQEFGHPPPACDITGLDNWAQVAWLDRAVATARIPKGPGTYDPPAPYRVFRLIQGKEAGQTGDTNSQAIPDF